MKKSLLIPSLYLSLVVSSIAEPAKSVITTDAKGSQTVYIQTASDKGLAYLANPKSTSPEQIARNKVTSIFFYRPSEFQNGLEAFNSGKFGVAKAAFQECKKKYAKLAKLPQNYSVRAAFYEMECVRREQNYAELGKLLDEFRPDNLVNENYLTQLQIYPFWEAYNKKAWKRILQMSTTWKEKKLPGYQKAQISFCYGMALKETGNTQDALLEFNKAIALSEFKEVELVLTAGEQVMEIHLADPLVSKCLATHKTPEPDMKTREYLRLLEAHSIAKYWEKSSASRPLPTKFKKLLDVKQPELEKVEPKKIEGLEE